MKKINITLSAAFMLLAILQFSSCTNNKVDQQPAPDSASLPKGLIQLHLHNVIDGQEVENYNDTLTASTGKKMLLTTGQLYLSHFQLIKKDGGIYTVPDSVILKVQDEEAYSVANVPVGNYSSIRFRVGLDSVANSKTPSGKSTDIFNRPEMWFGSMAQPDGYIFMNIQGKIDTSKTNNGISLQPFTYKIGTTANIRQVTLPNSDYTIIQATSTQSNAVLIHMYIDEFRLFDGIDLTKPGNLSVSTKAENSGSLATKISNNIPSMFSYEP